MDPLVELLADPAFVSLRAQNVPIPFRVGHRRVWFVSLQLGEDYSETNGMRTPALAVAAALDFLMAHDSQTEPQ